MYVDSKRQTRLFEDVPNERRKHKHANAEDFTRKFLNHNATDECYTPAKVYEAILQHVRETTAIGNAEIIRPFYPDKDYKQYPYPGNAVVVDNPPFSILSQIVKFYETHDIRYYLFAPHLTLFSIRKASTYIVTNTQIEYENKAKIKTAFVSNLYGSTRIIADTELRDLIVQAQVGSTAIVLPKYSYPDNVVTVSAIAKAMRSNRTFAIRAEDVMTISRLDDQYSKGKGIFGTGMLASDSVVRLLNELNEINESNEENKIIWKLSPRERAIIEQLNKQTK